MMGYGRGRLSRAMLSDTAICIIVVQRPARRNVKNCQSVCPPNSGASAAPHRGARMLVGVRHAARRRASRTGG
jgi:hypothetical protein